MLAYLEDFDLPLQQLLVLDVQVPLLDDLDGDLLLRVLVDATLDDAVLALPKRLPEVVEVEDVRIADRFLYGIHPFLFFRLF